MGRPMNYRKYKSYEEYLKHQGAKVESKEYSDKLFHSSNKRIIEFEKEFELVKSFLDISPVLCLGARDGCEVIAFRNLGFENSIGIDVNPSKSLNEGLVIKGDFQNLEFDIGSYSNAYTNCLDHSLNIEIVFNQIYRILKKDGKFIFRCSRRHSLGNSFESCAWNSLDEIIRLLIKSKFKIIYNEPISLWSNRDNLMVLSK